MLDRIKSAVAGVIKPPQDPEQSLGALAKDIAAIAKNPDLIHQDQYMRGQLELAAKVLGDASDQA